MEDPYLISLGLNGILEEIRDLNESDFREGNNIIDDSSLEWGDRRLEDFLEPENLKNEQDLSDDNF